jgi:ADP-ribose pyrophosphatase YjhB (NUDIX family)
MRIKETEVKIIQGEIFEVRADALVNPADAELVMSEDRQAIVEREKKFCPLDEDQVRANCRKVLEEASASKIRSIAMPALGCGTGAFSAVASAKIMAQEVLRHIRETQTSLKEIIFCLSSPTEYQVFEKNALGYLDYIVNKLKTPFLTVDAIIEINDGIVIIERSNPPFGNALPGGFVDYGESLEQAVIREAKEETGLEITNLRQFHTYSDPKRDPRFHTVGTVFIAQAIGEPKAGDDAAGAQVIPLEDIEKLEFAFDHRAILLDYLSSLKNK